MRNLVEQLPLCGKCSTWQLFDREHSLIEAGDHPNRNREQAEVVECLGLKACWEG